MASRTNELAKVAEATYWKVLGKKKRAENIESGVRETVFQRVTKGLAPAKAAQPEAQVVTAPSRPVPTEVAKPKAKTKAAAPKAKARVPFPFFAVAHQEFSSDKVIYSCIVGDRHMLEEVSPDLPFEHVLFADRQLPFEGWDQRPLLFWDANPKLMTLFHKFALVSLAPMGTKLIWRDSRVELDASVAESMFEALEDHDVCLFKHYERQCVYDEVVAVLAGSRAAAPQCEDYSRYLRSISFPRNAGLFETGLMGFKVTPASVALFRDIFGVCFRYVPRDQLALPIALSRRPCSVRLYADGASDLRNSPGVTVKAWPKELR